MRITNTILDTENKIIFGNTHSSTHISARWVFMWCDCDEGTGNCFMMV